MCSWMRVATWPLHCRPSRPARLSGAISSSVKCTGFIEGRRPRLAKCQHGIGLRDWSTLAYLGLQSYLMLSRAGEASQLRWHDIGVSSCVIKRKPGELPRSGGERMYWTVLPAISNVLARRSSGDRPGNRDLRTTFERVAVD